MMGINKVFWGFIIEKDEDQEVFMDKVEMDLEDM